MAAFDAFNKFAELVAEHGFTATPTHTQKTGKSDKEHEAWKNQSRLSR
jgi:hypothetical protein